MSKHGLERSWPLRVVVAGLGRVGSSDDANRPTPPRSHIGNLLAHPDFVIEALVEPNVSARHSAINQWPEIPPAVFVDCPSAISSKSIDLLVVATPTSTRAADLRSLLALNPEILLLENPLASNVTSGEQLKALLVGTKTDTRICYMRRFAKSLQAALHEFEEVPVKAVLRYTGGLLNNATHFIDLLTSRYGPVVEVQSLATHNLSDFTTDHPMDFRLRFRSGFDMYGHSLTGVCYGQLDCEIYFPSGKVELAGNGVDIRVFYPHLGYRFPGYTHLAPDTESSSQDFELGMAGMYDAVARHILHGDELLGCTVDQALSQLAIVDALCQSAKHNGTVVIPA